MRELLANRRYRRLFAAQVVALVGTGLMTVALGLLAFEIAGADAGIVLGIALTIKMAAYVGVAPVMAAVAGRVSRKRMLIGADLVRAGVALCLPLVSQTWHIYLLIAVLQSASATFTPVFQSTIPDIVPDERQYTRALSLSRLAYDLEALLSPLLASVLLLVTSYQNLFVGTTVGFVLSGLLVTVTRIPDAEAASTESFGTRLTAGVLVFWNRRDLRALIALNVVVAAGTAMVVVNTVVYAQGLLGRDQTSVAILLASYGAGSMVVALALPSALDRMPERPVMLSGALVVVIALMSAAAVTSAGDGAWPLATATWLTMGAGTALVLTPSARLLRDASDQSNRPSVFAAQFGFSHVCFAVTYPMAGFIGAAFGLPVLAAMFALVALVAAGVAARTWAPTVGAAEWVVPPLPHPHLLGAVTTATEPWHRHTHRHGLWVHAHAHRHDVRHTHRHVASTGRQLRS
jgi:MFS family permease